jgi:hypothetical protein
MSLVEAAREVNKIHEGRFVLVKTASQSFFLTSLHVAVQGMDGTAAQLCIYNLKVEPQELMRDGTHLVLLEPYFKYPDTRVTGSFPFLRCDNPQVVMLRHNCTRYLKLPHALARLVHKLFINGLPLLLPSTTAGRSRID